ncbi:hypothetical protein GXP67_06655 [Rhodocytophaga rosea]|uniref:Uncharacterized protein n=1 Tax=Rhodocytophaga rosea TaxID=2704465 RepID=A0A6C0GFB6_9BACT|nr:hypothetical protein [Rhodocytophaga rosea]QHT66360.1 hypothetical protein GXP67_06655 [Rhodocytophaga rosea]
MKIILFKMFLTFMASSVVSLLRKAKPVISSSSIFTAMHNGTQHIRSHSLIAYYYKDYLQLQIFMPGQRVLIFQLYGVTGTGIYEFSGQDSDNSNVVMLERKNWLEQIYTSDSLSGGGYIEIKSLTPFSIEATFSITIAPDDPDYNMPIAKTEFTQGYIKVPFLS